MKHELIKENSLAWDLGFQERIIHIGARYGEELNYYVNKCKARSIILFEPNPMHISGLHETVSRYLDKADITISNLALSNSSGCSRLTGFKGFSSGLSSLKSFNQQSMIEVFGADLRHHTLKESKENVFDVVTERLDDYLRKSVHEFKNSKIDLLNIDTQGSELDILQGARETLKRVSNIICEVTRIPEKSPYEDCPRMSTICKLLYSQGFFLMDYKLWGEFQHGQALFRRA